MKKGKKIMAAALSLCMLGGVLFGQNITSRVRAEENVPSDSSQAGGGQYNEEGNASEMLNGNPSDITLSGVSVSGSKAGGKVKISFTAAGNKNSKKHYEVERIERVYPVLNENFPFVMNDEAYRVTSGNSNSVSCSYTFTAKDNLETAYYLAGFAVVYSRRAVDGKTTTYESEYSITKNVNVKITAKPKSTPKPEKEEKPKDADISLKMAGTPYGVYGGTCNVAFTVYSSQYKITSVVPVIDNNFPFESTTDAYKVIRSSGVKSLACRYGFRVKSNVSTGYQGVAFRITYVKNGQTLSEDKTINVELQGKKKETEQKGKKSTPRVMVAGYTTDVKKIMPNSKFALNLQVQNNASQSVRNVKITLSTENGEFLPVSGASAAYVDRIGAKSSVTLTFRMKASANLGSKSYSIKVKSEYEDDKANAYDAEDHVSIPVTLQEKISLTDVIPPDMLSMGSTADLSFSINNMGGDSLNNVSVRCKGEGISCEKTFVGSIAAGATGYANVTLMGEEVTPEDSDGECRIIITYENAAGETKKYVEKTNVYVTEEMNDVMMEEEGMEETTPNKVPTPAVVIGIVVILIIIIAVIRRILKKRRLKREEELMDDELL